MPQICLKKTRILELTTVSIQFHPFPIDNVQMCGHFSGIRRNELKETA